MNTPDQYSCYFDKATGQYRSHAQNFMNWFLSF